MTLVLLESSLLPMDDFINAGKDIIGINNEIFAVSY